MEIIIDAQVNFLFTWTTHQSTTEGVSSNLYIDSSIHYTILMMQNDLEMF